LCATIGEGDRVKATRGMLSFALAAGMCCGAIAGKDGAGQSAELKRELDRYGMVSGECRREGGGNSVTVRWAAFRPKSPSHRLPVLVFMPGLGELGPDLANLFRNRGLFDLVTSPAFQKRHPCVLVALQTEAGVERNCLEAGRPELSLSTMWDALREAVAKVGKHKIDSERIYLTGLSAGGGACCSMMCAYPGRFAAALPVAGAIIPSLFSKTKPENIWMMYNSGELERARNFVDFDAMSREMAARGGEFRVGELTGAGHNAWDAAWREDAAWDWLFSKRARPLGANVSRARPVAPVRNVRHPPRDEWKCSASAVAESAVSQPRFGADGLESTVYRSASAAKKGEWWQVEFPTPVRGSIRISTGDSKGKSKVIRGTAMVSSDGRHWTKAVAVRDGTASFRADRSVAFVRLVVDANQTSPLVVREFELR